MTKVSRRTLLLSSVAGTLVLSRYAPDYLIHASIWQTATALLSILLLARFTYHVVLWPKYLSPLRHIPQAPGASFFMGHFSKIVKDATGMPMREWALTVPNDGIVRYLWAFNAERVLVLGPKALAEVLTQKSYEFIKPPQIQAGLGRILGIGILLAEGDEHKRQRKLLNPAFAYRNIKDLYPIFWAKSREMVRQLDIDISKPPQPAPSDTTISPTEENPGVIIDVGATVSRATLDMIGLAGFEADFNAIADPSNALSQTYRRVFDQSPAARVLMVLGIFLPFWLLRLLPLKRNTDIAEASKEIRSACMEIIQSKKRKLEKGESVGTDILGIALRSGGFKDEELVDQIMTMAAAGHETTASAMTWAIYLLCTHPHIQTKLRSALHAARLSPRSPTSPHEITSETLDKIPYLHAVCNEVLRFFPPVPYTMRLASSPNSTISGVPIPQNTTIILVPTATNHSPQFWGPTAGEFDPERWIDSKTGQADNSGGATSNYGFLTFLHGARSCIGQGFAKAEFACLLAAWVGGFEARFVEEGFVAKVGGGITTKPKGGLRVYLRRVEEGVVVNG